MLNQEIVTFAAGNTDCYVAFQDYFCNKAVQTSENHEKLNKAFFAEVNAKSGVNAEGLSTEALLSHPSYRWSFMSVTDAVINAILPNILTDTIGLIADLRFVSPGDIVKFKIMPNQFFTVSKGGTGERTIHRQKDFAADVVISPVEHIVTVYVDMYRVMAGKEDIVDFVRRVVLAIEQSMYADILDALTTGLAAIPQGTYNVTGAFDMGKLVKMAETVEVYNAGSRPMIVGSATALMKVLPDSTLGYRGNFDANGGSIELIKDVYGYDVMRLKNAASKAGGLVLPDDTVFVVSPAVDKLVKVAVSNALTNINQFRDAADISQNYTARKNWEAVFATAAKAGVYKITD